MGRPKGFKNSEIAKQKMRENNWSKRGFVPSMLGKHHSEETKKRMTLAHTGYKFSDEAKNKMALAKIGKSFRLGCKHSDEAKQRMSLSHKGQIPWITGKKWSEEHKQKLSVIHKGKILSEKHKKNIGLGVKKNLPKTVFKKGENTGKNNYNWNNGSSFKPYPLGWTDTFKEQIRYRDGYKCQLCRMPEIENIRKLAVHHIDYEKSNLNPENLISLCFKCHHKTNYNRKSWIEHFKEKKLCENY